MFFVEIIARCLTKQYISHIFILCEAYHCFMLNFCLEIRSHLTDQVKCLDQQHDSRVNLLNDIQDFFKRKSEVESEYAKKLDVLSEKFFTKHKNLFAQRYIYIHMQIYDL